MGYFSVSAAVTPAVIALDYADKTLKPRVTLSENSSTSETEATENEAPEADSKRQHRSRIGRKPEANTLSAEELKALKERLYLAAKESMTRPTGETHNGAPEVGTQPNGTPRTQPPHPKYRRKPQVMTLTFHSLMKYLEE